MIEIQTSPDSIKSVVRSLISLLIADQNRSVEMQERIYPEMLPADMQDERHILAAIYQCEQLGSMPTKTNVANILTANQRVQEPAKKLEELESIRPTDAGGPRAIAAAYFIWHKNKTGELVAQDILNTMASPLADYEEKYEKSHRMLTAISPRRRDTEEFDEDQWIESFIRRQEKRAENAAAGFVNGPGLPFEAQKVFFRNLEWGQLTSIIADTGRGKTSLMFVLGEYNAWNSPINSDVCVISLETPTQVLQMRQFSRHMLIPYDALSSGRVKPSDEKWKPLFDAWKKAVKNKSKNSGYMRYIYTPSRSYFEVLDVMQKQAELSHAAGRGIIFFIDYLQKFNWTEAHRMSEASALAIIGEEISGKTRALNLLGNTHTFLLAQENVNTGEAFGSSVIRKISQVMFSVQRDMESPTVSVPIKDPKTGQIAKDALEGPRYWCREKDDGGYKGSLEIRKGNDVRNVDGRKIDVLFEMAFYRIVQDPLQIKRLKDMKVLE